MKLELAEKFMEIHGCQLTQYDNEDCSIVVEDIGKFITDILDNNTLFNDNILAINETFKPLTIKQTDNYFTIS